MAGGTFFNSGGGEPAVAAAYAQPRPMVAGAQVINLNKARTRNPIRTSQAWQIAAWDYTDQIGEMKYAFGLISGIVSRAVIFPAVNVAHDEVPVDTKDYLNSVTEGQDAEEITRACKLASEYMSELVSQSEILRRLAMNFGIAGECYLVNLSEWTIASISEIKPGTPPKLQRYRDATKAIDLPKNTYIARLWRAHGRWSGEADSSVLGVLDQAEKIVLFDQVIRAVSRSRLGAGIVYYPSGLVPASGRSIEEALAEVTTEPVEDEASQGTVVPLLLSGPSELGKELKRIDLARELDPQMIQASETAMDRLLAGLDIPKDIISGLADVRYSNALVIDDSLYKAHIEPMLMLICDALTDAYLRPRLRKAGIDSTVIDQIVVWYNPSNIVTRPDRSQSANEGYDRFLLSGEAWRNTRGYNELDAPSPEELIRRLALEKTQIPPDMATAMLEHLYPEFFQVQRKKNQEAAGVPPEVSQLLEGGNPQDEAPPPTPPPGARTERNGGGIPQGGSMPPRENEEPA